jgi:uncharacterized Zn finger protein
MAGEVPPELEAAFDAAGVLLLPSAWRQLTASCSCPDFENPCKHIAAVLYVFADQLDRDPWLLVTWRGRTRAELLAHLSATTGPGAGEGTDALPPWWPLRPDQPTATIGRAALGARFDELSPPDPPQRVLDRLDPFDDPTLLDRLGPLYVALLPREPAG